MGFKTQRSDANTMVLGPLLFVIYISDLEESVTGLLSKFAVNTKVGGFADNDEDHQRIQQDVDQLETWAERWQMEFNPDKCEVMHFGRSNTDRKYTVNGRTLKSIDRQRDLGVQVHRSQSGNAGGEGSQEGIRHACLHRPGH